MMDSSLLLRSRRLLQEVVVYSSNCKEYLEIIFLLNVPIAGRVCWWIRYVIPVILSSIHLSIFVMAGCTKDFFHSGDGIYLVSAHATADLVLFAYVLLSFLAKSRVLEAMTCNTLSLSQNKSTISLGTSVFFHSV